MGWRAKSRAREFEKCSMALRLLCDPALGGLVEVGQYSTSRYLRDRRWARGSTWTGVVSCWRQGNRSERIH